MLCVSGCLRGLFVAAEGHDLIASDFSSIEGVVTACLAGEDWRVEMFATHGKAYELSVAKITGKPFAEIMAHAGYDDVESPKWWTRRARKGEHHPLRQTIGKVAELASGFGGWINAWRNFGADKFMSDEEIKQAILAWRQASPNIVEFWGGQVRGWDREELFGLEGAAVRAVLAPGQWAHVMRKNGTHTGVSYICHNGALYCWLPSGRALTYHNPRLDPNTRGFGGAWSLSYEGWNSNPLAGGMGWVRMNTYGGKLCENVVQAVARDIQRHAIVNLERKGYPVVLHVYDEDVVEVPQGFGSVEELERIMGTMPPWAVYNGKSWPIRAAGGWRGRRYRKD
jgi:DNA polymerase